MKFYNRETTLRFASYFFAVFGIAAGVFGGMFSAVNEKVTTTVSAQQDPFLSQRINQIEQRFNSIESRLNRVESESRLPVITPRIGENNEADVRLLRSQLEALQLRLAEVECGVLRLDERTLTSAARQARKKDAAGESERCRLNSNAPLQIFSRP